MVEWKSIEELRQLYINKYEQSKIVAELENAYSLEYSFRTDYNGRQILELLQNVDDAINNSSENVDPTVRIVYKNNILEVGNMGTTFSAEAIDRICLGAASDKTEIDIGNKGIGFRSLLNNAEWIEIHSGEYHIRFSERFSNNIFRENLKHIPFYNCHIEI